MQRMILGIAIAVSMLGVAGCGKKEASKGNFKSAIQDYLDTTPGLCVSLPSHDASFRVGRTSFETEPLAKYLSLSKVGLLTVKEVETQGILGRQQVFEFALNDDGRKYLVQRGGFQAGALCTGKRRVTEVVNFTEPSEMMGAKISRANYRYKVEDADAWSRDPQVVMAFRELKASDDAEDTAVLVATSEGWMHERLFRKQPH